MNEVINNFENKNDIGFGILLLLKILIIKVIINQVLNTPNKDLMNY
jgi:hypothetical protein